MIHVDYVGYITYTCKGRYRSSNSGRMATTEGTPRIRRTRLMLLEAARPSPPAAARGALDVALGGAQFDLREEQDGVVARP